MSLHKRLLSKLRSGDSQLNLEISNEEEASLAVSVSGNDGGGE